MDDMFDNYGGFPSWIDPELESALKKCKTEKEMSEVVEEYVIANVKAALIALAIVMFAAIFAGVISYLKTKGWVVF